MNGTKARNERLAYEVGLLAASYPARPPPPYSDPNLRAAFRRGVAEGLVRRAAERVAERAMKGEKKGNK
jgi:hypothetical protein